MNDDVLTASNREHACMAFGGIIFLWYGVMIGLLWDPFLA
jgi:hypothetical protein